MAYHQHHMAHAGYGGAYQQQPHGGGYGYGYGAQLAPPPLHPAAPPHFHHHHLQHHHHGHHHHHVYHHNHQHHGHHHHHHAAAGPMGIAVPAPVAQPQAQPSSSPAATAELRAWFAAVDTARTGRINCDQLRAALSSSGFDFRAGTAERLVRMFDRDRSSTIEFDEFIKAHGFIRDLAAGFRARDTDGSGVLEGPEVREALAISGFRLTEPTFQITMRKFDHQKRGGLRFDDYIDLSITIGTARNVFAFYDRNKSDLVTFDFNAFFAAQLAAYV